MCSPSGKGCSTQYIFLDFLYVIEECFHLVYRLLLLQFDLGWAIFYYRSPGLSGVAKLMRKYIGIYVGS